MPSARLFFATAILVVVAVHTAQAAQLVQVFLDARNPAYVVIEGVAADTSDQARSEMAGYAALERVSLIRWDVFRKDAGAIIAPYVVKNDYPGTSSVLGVLTLIKMYPGKPFAITWNGGIATSFQDYQYAVKTYRDHAKDAHAYARSRPTDPAKDPLNPTRQMARLLE